MALGFILGGLGLGASAVAGHKNRKQAERERERDREMLERQFRQRLGLSEKQWEENKKWILEGIEDEKAERRKTRKRQRRARRAMALLLSALSGGRVDFGNVEGFGGIGGRHRPLPSRGQLPVAPPPGVQQFHGGGPLPDTSSMWGDLSALGLQHMPESWRQWNPFSRGAPLPSGPVFVGGSPMSPMLRGGPMVSSNPAAPMLAPSTRGLRV